MDWGTLISGAAVAALITGIVNWRVLIWNWNSEVHRSKDQAGREHETWLKEQVLEAATEASAAMSAYMSAAYRYAVLGNAENYYEYNRLLVEADSSAARTYNRLRLLLSADSNIHQKLEAQNKAFGNVHELLLQVKPDDSSYEANFYADHYQRPLQEASTAVDDAISDLLNARPDTALRERNSLGKLKRSV